MAVPTVPLLRWVGGKRSILPILLAARPRGYRSYYEPFLGGGAFFFGGAGEGAEKVVLGDVNSRLIGFYETVRDNREALAAAVAAFGDGTSRDEHMRVRSIDPDTLEPTEAAAWFYWLNQACFNVPWGRRRPLAVTADDFAEAAEALQGAELVAAPYWETVADAKAGDFVYFDPPYIPASETAYFTNYARGGFGRMQQRMLAAVIAELDERGVAVMLSNSDTPLTRRIYGDCGLTFHSISVRRSVSADGASRGRAPEILAVNYPLEESVDAAVVEAALTVEKAAA